MVSDEIVRIVAPIVLKCGSRPSELFHWNDDDDWYDRLMFDSLVCNEIMKKERK